MTGEGQRGRERTEVIALGQDTPKNERRSKKVMWIPALFQNGQGAVEAPEQSQQLSGAHRA